MYILDGIAYAGEPKPFLKVSGVRAMKDYVLWVRFSNGEEKMYDCKPLLDKEAFLPLKNPEVFNCVYIDYGITVWQGGDIDISPEELYENGVPCVSAETA